MLLDVTVNRLIEAKIKSEKLNILILDKPLLFLYVLECNDFLLLMTRVPTSAYLLLKESGQV